MERYRQVIFKLVLVFIYMASTEGTTLVVPPAGNCGDETTLTCQYTGTYSGHLWLKVGSGTINPGNNPDKYRAETGTSSVILIIKNTEISDAGEYKCSANFVSSLVENLNFECKASSVTPQIGIDKKLMLTVDRLYPTPATFTVTVTTAPQQVTGSHSCTASTRYPGYQRCVWTSECLSPGTYSYSVTVVTVTQATPLTGSQTIVSPDSPAISNTETISGSRDVVRAVEGQPVTLQCTSGNGVPRSTLAWHRGSTSSAAVEQRDTDVLSHQITPTRRDDRVSYICRSWYPQAAAGCRDSKTETAMLYLTLSPNPPQVTQTNSDVAEGQQISLQCTSTGGRPAATLSWTYRGQPVTGPTTDSEQAPDETFTVRSDYSRIVNRQDNNQQVDCTATLTPFAGQTGNTNISVRFAPTNVTITGNQVIVANGVNSLDLTCTTGTSNPASSITWDFAGVTNTPVRADQTPDGNYGGKLTVSVQRLKPTRDDDGKTISCSASNTVNPASPQSGLVTLDLHYKPLITPIADVVAVEGRTSTLPCSASSKPPSTFTWKRDTTTVDTGAGSTGNNKHDYVIQDVDRNQDATYTCTASNGIGTADTMNAQLTVHYAPDISVTTSSNNIQEGVQLQIDCSAAGKPTNYNFNGFTQTWRGTTIKPYPGNSVAIPSLSLENSGTYTCVANNGVPDRDGTMDQTGSKSVLVKVKPKVLTTQHEFHGSTIESINIRIPFYSYPPYTSLSIRRQGTPIDSDSRVTIDTSPGEVTATFFGISVTLDGHIVTLVIPDPTDTDMTNYTLEIQNEVGITTWPFWISLRGVPDPPENLRVLDSFTSPMFIWGAGMNGGYEQTFVIEVAPEGTNGWAEEVHVVEDDHMHMIQDGLYAAEVVGLDPGSYTSRISSRNRLGTSEYLNIASTFSVTAAVQSLEPEQQVSAGAIAGGVVAGIEAIIIIVVVVVVIILLRRIKQIQKDAVKQTSDKTEKVQMTETRPTTQPYYNIGGNTAQTERTEEEKPNVYETLDPELRSAGLYDTPEPKARQRQAEANPEYINMEL